jgi:hypothetical protein
VLRVTEECKKTHYSTTIIIFHQATLTLNYWNNKALKFWKSPLTLW